MPDINKTADLIAAALRDADNDGWTKVSILSAILEAEQLIAIHHPQSTATDVTFTCVAGIKQSITTLTPKGHVVLDVKYNVNDGDAGRAIRRVPMADLDAINPNWRSGSGSFVREFMIDDREPTVFYVNPPVEAGATVRITYSAIPTFNVAGVTSGTMTTVNDTYQAPIIEFALYRLFGHDVEGSVNAQRSQQHLANFSNFLGVKVSQIPQNSPKNPEHKR